MFIASRLEALLRLLLCMQQHAQTPLKQPAATSPSEEASILSRALLSGERQRKFSSMLQAAAVKTVEGILNLKGSLGAQSVKG